jgi:hypothetical protein
MEGYAREIPVIVYEHAQIPKEISKYAIKIAHAVPLSCDARALMLMRGKAVSAWRIVRGFLPTNVKTSLERRLFLL